MQPRTFLTVLSLAAVLGAESPRLVGAQSVIHDLESAAPIGNGEFGLSVSVMSELTGGIQGIVVGADQEAAGGIQRGTVSVFNASTGSLVDSITSPNGEDNGFFGYDVSSVPDITGDGIDEIVVGAPTEDPGASPDAAGRAYIFNGSTRALLQTLTSSNEEIQGNFGISVAGLGDITGDGLGDVVVGALNEDPGASPLSAGRAYVVNGSSGANIATLISPADINIGYFGTSVASVPDIEGNADNDILVGAPGEEAVHLYRSDTFEFIRTFSASTTSANFGQAVAGVPDISGDGFGEVLVSAREEDFGAFTDAGRAYLFNGRTGALIHTLQSPAPRNSGYYSTSVAALEDISGDGFPELIVGSEEGPGATGSFAGRVYVYNGVTGGLLATIFSSNEISAGLFGIDVAGIADVSSDGFADIVVGALGENYTGNPAGSGTAYVIGSIPVPVNLSLFGLD